MALQRGKFGIEYDPHQAERENHGFGWVMALVAVAALILLTWTLVRHVKGGDELPQLIPPEQTAEENAGPSVETESAKPSALTTAQVFKTLQPLDPDVAHRPPKLRNLLLRLDVAKERKDIEMAVTTIEDIRRLPGNPAADLDDSLARQLGALNVQKLFELRSALWVKPVTVKRGDSAARIAIENGSTVASLMRLNGGAAKMEKLVAGQRLLVLNHPRFNLVMHKRTRIADLSLNGKFFKRYDLNDPIRARPGAYEMPDSRKLFWQGIGSCFRPEDRAEIEILLPRATPVIVSEM